MARIWPADTTVLLAEDDILIARMLETRMAMEGLKVLKARHGLEALEVLGGHLVDIVVTDLMMPAMNGYRLIREIRQLPPPHGSVPILVISANQVEDDIVACFAAGADDFMTKPISVTLMMERIWRLHRRVPR
jgi:CheY-like chemotaxis protein